MSIQRIVSTDCGSYGWQARAHVAPGWRLTRFFSDDQHGGKVIGPLRRFKCAECVARSTQEPKP